MFTLKKKKDKDFVILNFTDIHLRNKSWANNTTKKAICTYIIKTLTEQVQPDLITVSGDISYPGSTVAYEHTVEFLDAFGIPWAVIWGNHDQEDGPESVSEAEEIILKSKHCLYEAGDPSVGRGNYLIGIEEEGRPVEALIMMDGHAKLLCYDENGVVQAVSAKMTEEQIRWYREQVSYLKNAGYKESSIFVHIPIYAYKEAFEAALIKGLNPREIRFDESYSPVFWNEGYKDSVGVVHDRVTCYPGDDGVFKAILEEDHTKTVLCGHDHRNSFVITHKGVRLAYSLRTGGIYDTVKTPAGGTVIRIGSEGVTKIEQMPVDTTHFAKK